MNTEKELLDFCRVKKIFDKGFGFLTSLYHEENVFFHFSKISDNETKEKLVQKKRGVVYLYYTSIEKDGRRKVARVWSDINRVNEKLIPDFISKITDEFNEGHTNIFELAGVVNQLRIAGYISKDELQNILNSNKVLNNISVAIPILLDHEKELFEDIQKFIDEKLENEIPAKQIADEIILKLF